METLSLTEELPTDTQTDTPDDVPQESSNLPKDETQSSADSATAGPSPEERRARAIWTAIAQPGEPVVGQVIGHFGVMEALERVKFLAAKLPEIDDMIIRTVFQPARLPASVAQVEGWAMRLRELNLEMEYQLLSRDGGTLVVPGDAAWPMMADDLGMVAPLALWVRGNPRALQALAPEGAVALVGARCATHYGTDIAQEIAYELGERGIWVISGGAYGIDAAAHQGALASRGKTISVQAGGLGELYPAMNARLFSQIQQTGAIVSEAPPSQRPAKHLFLTRNRIISALSQVVVVVEAGERSGAMSTANHGAEQGRQVAAVPGPVTSAASIGCHRLIREGAALVTSAEEILELMFPLNAVKQNVHGGGAAAAEPPRNSAGQIPAPSLFAGLSSDGVKVIDSLSKTAWKSLEQVARGAGLGTRTVQSELGLMELDGKVETRNGRYRLGAAALAR
ncbi:DNA-processing protein DprA [uncultured Mobiluncus sp.]|uniref:DNA-processing protein DprA n=1 Tax=uncultured Mobiluncus sp. TaxID=293425 RepID=UPI00288C5DD5|nr:DNA-processing protein DprA [uncultured Mobiluncus sp.]